MRHSKIYTEIIRHPLISVFAKTLYCGLKSHTSDKDNSAWPSQAKLARYMSSTEKTVRTHLYELAYWGVIAEKWFQGYTGKANTYFLQDEIAAAKIYRNQCPQRAFDPRLDLPGYPHPGLPTKETHSKDNPIDQNENPRVREA